MRVVVLSATTGELVWDHTNPSFWQIRGWELRGWLCEAMSCAQYFSVILLVRQLLLCDMAYIGEYADGEVLTVYMLRRGIANPTDSNLQQATEALRHSNRFGLWAVLSQGIHMRVLLPEISGGTGRVIVRWSQPFRADIRKTLIKSTNYPTLFKPCSGLAARHMTSGCLRCHRFVKL